MKKSYGVLLVLFALTLMGVGTDPCHAAGKGEPATLHRDGTAFVKESRITQADRQAAADRAKAKGFVAPMVGAAKTPGPPVIPASPGKSNQADKGVSK